MGRRPHPRKISHCDFSFLYWIIIRRRGGRASTCIVYIYLILGLERVMNFWICTCRKQILVISNIFPKICYLSYLSRSSTYLLLTSTYKLFRYILKFLKIRILEKIMKVFLFTRLGKNTRVNSNKIFASNIKKKKEQNTYISIWKYCLLLTTKKYLFRLHFLVVKQVKSNIKANH